MLNAQLERGEYDPVKNPNGGYYVTYKSMSYWGDDDNGRPILRSPMAECVDGQLTNAYIIANKDEPINWYQSTETIDKKTGIPKGLKVKTKNASGKDTFVSAVTKLLLIMI